MQTKAFYYVILLVYILLLFCQCTACHLTHSLIIMTDSYINMYKILDISLGIIHLETQKEARAGTKEECRGKAGASVAARLFGRACTYQFKRLPVLGSFVNGLFLAALLMSAAIEGIQTCFHASHSGAGNEKSILLNHPITYPAVLAGFALVGIGMQWCSDKAHEMREDELNSESRWDLTAGQAPSRQAPVAELNAARLEHESNRLKNQNPVHSSLPAIDSSQGQRGRRSNFFGGGGGGNGGSNDSNKFVLNQSGTNKRHSSSFESIPLDAGEPVKQKQVISLTSLKVAKDFEDPNYVNIMPLTNSNSDLEAELVEARRGKLDGWLLVRYWISPMALTVCALIVYFINESDQNPNCLNCLTPFEIPKELITEIADAALAIMVVVLLFSASYPPMKKAGKILLQTAPDQVDVDRLRASLMSVSPLIQTIEELHVWSLTARSKRVATCHIVLEKGSIESGKRLSQILEAIKAKFLAHNIKCSTIQPVFQDLTEPDNCRQSSCSSPSTPSTPSTSCHDATTATNNTSCAH